MTTVALWCSFGARKEPISIIFAIALGLLIGSLFGALGGLSEKQAIPKKYETYYQVIISDNVNITEFLEKYEIVGQNGKIYTVKEKN
jgi:hypothetical protein